MAEPKQPEPIPRFFLTMEIRGGSEGLRAVCRNVLTLEMESAVLMLQMIHGHRKGCPELIIHPISVEA